MTDGLTASRRRAPEEATVQDLIWVGAACLVLAGLGKFHDERDAPRIMGAFGLNSMEYRYFMSELRCDLFVEWDNAGRHYMKMSHRLARQLLEKEGVSYDEVRPVINKLHFWGEEG